MSSHTHLWYVKSGHFGTMDREYSCTGLVKCRCSSRPCYLLVFIVEWHWLFFSYGMCASSLHLFLGLATNMVLNSGTTSSWQLWSDTFTGQKERSIAIKMEARNVIFLVCLLKRITSTYLTVYTFDLYTHQVPPPPPWRSWAILPQVSMWYFKMERRSSEGPATSDHGYATNGKYVFV